MSHARNNSKLETRNSKQKKLVPLLLSWFAQNARDLPWRRTREPYAIWVSEIMLQQTQVKTVIPYWERWMRELPTIQSLANASSQTIYKLWEGLGYYTRVRNMQKAAQQILEKHDGKFPGSFDDILALPGIGRYTAGAICSIALNQPTPILDGNVIRVLTRIFGIAENPREKETNARLWQLAEELVRTASEQRTAAPDHKHPKLLPLLGERVGVRASVKHSDQNACSRLNQSLMELGALICTPRSPQCEVCPVQKLCVAFHENRQAELPNLGKRAAATERRFIAFAVERDGKFFVRQRPAGVVNAHLWEFPNVELGTRLSPAAVASPGNGADKFQTAPAAGPLRLGQPRSAAKAAQTFGVKLQNAKPFCTIKHSITRYRMTLEVYRAGAPISRSARTGIPSTNVPNRSSALQGRWRNFAELKKLSFPSAHKKILAALADAP
jgi:A/G-specific adenine glycosylase